MGDWGQGRVALRATFALNLDRGGIWCRGWTLFGPLAAQNARLKTTGS